MTDHHDHFHKADDSEILMKTPLKHEQHNMTRLELANMNNQKTFNQLVVASIIALVFLGC
jgi:hypothetical protein